MVRNARYSGAHNRFYRGDRDSIEETVKTLIEKIKKTTDLVVIPKFVDVDPLSLRKDHELKRNKLPAKLIMSSNEYINRYTGSGSIYHGTSIKSGLSILRGGIIASDSSLGQGASAFGPGGYTSPMIEIATSYAGESGMTLKFRLKNDPTITILDWEKASKHPFIAIQVAARAKLKNEHIHETLRSDYGVDAIITAGSQILLLLNTDIVAFPDGPLGLMQSYSRTITNPKALYSDRIEAVMNYEKLFALVRSTENHALEGPKPAAALTAIVNDALRSDFGRRIEALKTFAAYCTLTSDHASDIFKAGIKESLSDAFLSGLNFDNKKEILDNVLYPMWKSDRAHFSENLGQITRILAAELIRKSQLDIFTMRAYNSFHHIFNYLNMDPSLFIDLMNSQFSIRPQDSTTYLGSPAQKQIDRVSFYENLFKFFRVIIQQKLSNTNAAVVSEKLGQNYPVAEMFFRYSQENLKDPENKHGNLDKIRTEIITFLKTKAFKKSNFDDVIPASEFFWLIIGLADYHGGYLYPSELDVTGIPRLISSLFETAEVKSLAQRYFDNYTQTLDWSAPRWKRFYFQLKNQTGWKVVEEGAIQNLVPSWKMLNPVQKIYNWKGLTKSQLYPQNSCISFYH